MFERALSSIVVTSALPRKRLWHEQPGVARPHYLFKLRLTKNVKRALARIPWPMWEGQPTLGMEQHAETMLQ